MAVITKFSANSSMNVITTLWLTASPTPFGPPRAVIPLYDATSAATAPNTSALISPVTRSGT